MAINQWDPINLPTRPGLYANFVEAAAAQIQGGVRGTVAIPLKAYNGGSAEASKFYTVENEADAKALFGEGNIASIKLALAGGAKKVLVYTLPATPDMALVREAFEAQQFNAFVFDGEATAAEQDATLTWVKKNRNERKHFWFVTGGTAADDQDVTKGNARSTKLADDYVINLIVGGENNGVKYSSGQYAAFIAGLAASTPINKSITYAEIPVDDVNKRLRNSEIESALKAGSLVLFHDGEKVKVERGITTSLGKIRKISARQQIATDIERTARDQYIGKLDNNEDGQMALINAIKAYLETLQSSNVLQDIVVKLDPTKESKGDQVFLFISFTEIDSMEQIFLSINV